MCRIPGLQAIAALCVLAFPSWSRAQVRSPLQATSWPLAPAPRAISPAALPVTVDFDALRKSSAGDELSFQYAGDRLTAIVERTITRSPTSWSITCRVESDPDGFVILCVEEDALAGLIQSSKTGKLYRISYIAEGVHEFTPVGPIPIPDCKTVDGGPAPRAGSNGQTPPPSAVEGGCLAPPTNGDVMIYYTPAARAEAGGVNAMNAQCQLAVDTANQTYVDSVISDQLTLVFRGEIAYIDSGVLETDRDRLKGTSDGFMDFVHADRDYYGADFVSLFVRDSDACGIAYCTPSGPEEGFCVVDSECASTNFSFAHEIGHLQGCAHNREDAGSGCNQDCYSFGHRFFGNSGSGWRTVMSYNNDTGDFTRIGRWSNPDIFFDGQPCGIWTGNCDDDNRFNAATVSGTAPNRETWRNPKFDVWVERFAPAPYTGTFFDPFPTVQAGVDAVFAGGDSPVPPVLHLKAQTYPETLTLSRRMTITACGGVAAIGG